MSGYNPFERLTQQLFVLNSGDSLTAEVEVRRYDQLQDLTGHEVWMTIKRTKDAADPVLVLTTGNDLVVAQPAQGRVVVSISAAHSAMLEPYQTLFFDLRVRSPEGLVYTAAEGRIFVRKPTTNLS